jgi:nucleoside-diphosphate-sugar epimerase
MISKTLIIGACGQIGSELAYQLRAENGAENVIAIDIRESNLGLVNSGPFEIADAKSINDIEACIRKHNVDTVYLMAAMLSATGERFPEKAWDLNMTSLLNVLNLAKEKVISKVFWPSSIAVFGPTTPKTNTPQRTIMEPTTVYGITKQVGERWCEYYHNNYGVDVRSIRYPGIISWKTLPGGGTTDYAIDIFHKAINDGHYNCFLTENTALPMMYMDDAVKATLDIMNANPNDIKIRSSYNLAAISFTPKELAEEIKKQLPDFSIEYEPDFRQKIADTWPNSIDDSAARKDWHWKHSYDLEAMTNEMLAQLGSAKSLV